MNDNTREKWIGGIVVPGIGLGWGIFSLVSREIIVPIRWIESLPFYENIPRHG
jgi:hypothetical protein